MRHPVYAIGDIHGELDLLHDAIGKIERDGGDDAHVVFVGDYVDRGPQSREVLDYLIDGLAKGKNWKCLIGNHDRMFSMFMEVKPRTDPRLRRQFHWLDDRLGGKETLASYGVDATDDASVRSIHKQARTVVPKAHIEFINSLDYHYQYDDLLFAHAGVRPGVPLARQSKDDLIWIRDEFLEDTTKHPWLVVHGHTPVPYARHFGNHVNLDTGSGYGDVLSAAVFEGDDCWILKDYGRDQLLPEPL